MKFTNTSVKIIGVNGRLVLPDETVDLTEEEAELVEVYVDMGFGVFGEPSVNDKTAFDAAVQEAAKKLAAEIVAAQNAESAVPAANDEVVQSDGAVRSETDGEPESGAAETAPAQKRTRSRRTQQE